VVRVVKVRLVPEEQLQDKEAEREQLALLQELEAVGKS